MDVNSLHSATTTIEQLVLTHCHLGRCTIPWKSSMTSWQQMRPDNIFYPLEARVIVRDMQKKVTAV